eukprot:CAMPEP_0202686040 /NCGR_PEP_ID=MMETSP1385-20130828/1834_1 /ASSEMBLY_ACC=CAM_ASM_000861 /TAXON_ID=933848 /ORGANISM="Elphidium margaritaceum" /LENGTH=573 /DNA_ID=CAMNT_0049340537 /DNA_START=47 /DNA_END=1768 /DNA_ORIENTATION=+
MAAASCLLLITYLLRIQVEGVIRKTRYGRVEGVIEDGIQKYVGIPYAKPPVGDLRFAPPEEPDAWCETVYDATGLLSDVASCPQGDSVGAPSIVEDCLYLNIFAPIDSHRHIRPRYPVMIFIHGGSFIRGSSTLPVYDFTNFVEQNQGVIVVSFNYRIGLLGWLYDNTFETKIRGNFGYQDQQLLIRWVRKNIKYFGGDKHQITLMGNSAGGYSVALHALYNNDCAGIVGGILQSPPFSVPSRDPVSWNDVPQQFSDLVGCPTETEHDVANILSCWRSVDTETIVSIQEDEAFTNDWPWAPGIYTPTVQTELIPNQPLFAFQDASSKQLRDVPPLIISTVRDELFWSYDAFLDAAINSAGYYGLFAALTQLFQDAGIALTILNHYGITPSTGSLTGNWYYDFIEIATDNWYCAVRNVSDNAANKMNDAVYYLNFDFVDTELYQHVTPNEVCWTRACHLFDTWFAVSSPALLPLFEEYGADTLGLKMQEYFTNFVIHGDPNGDCNQTEVRWPEYSSGDAGIETNFLRILDPENFVQQSTFTDGTRVGTNAISSSNDLCAFWDATGYLFGAQRPI